MFAIDFKGSKNLLAQEIPSAVGLRGFLIAGLGEFDFDRARVMTMLRAGTLREVSTWPR
ncbi:MAG: hypothetical protein J0I23_28165 [Rhizobiales bacterium]|nr:hypothetical protein [Hyphomicrobiales bacterium]